MPKKKLTKAQVKRKIMAARNALYDMYVDRLAYSKRSLVPMSDKLVYEVLRKINLAEDRFLEKYQK